MKQLNERFDEIYNRRIVVADDTEWLRLKHAGLGGTDKAILAGISKWNTPVGLFYEKIAEFENKPQAWNITMERGKALEPLIVNIYERTYPSVKRVWHNKNNDLYIHPDHDYLLCTVDGIGLDENLPDIELLECKSAAGKGSQKWYSGIPEMYLVQLQSNMDVVGLDYGCLAWIVDDIPGTIKIERDKELCASLNYIAERFWFDNVLADKPPTPQSVDDYKKIYSNCIPNTKLQCSEKLFETMNEYLLVKDMIKDYDSQTSLLKARESDLYALIRKSIRDMETIEYDGEVVATCKLSKNGVRRLNINSKIINSLKEKDNDS